MSELFKLEKEEFADQEQRWTYLCLFDFIFNYLPIKKITITDHTWKKEGREWITKEMILEILKNELNGRKMRPRKKHGSRDVFVEERISYQGKKYRLIFWFKDKETSHLWIRNCYPID